MRLGPGDALLLRTGRWVRREEVGPTREMAGWDASVIPFLAERDIALLGADSVHEAPDSVPGLRVNPIPPLRHRGARHEPARQHRPRRGGGDRRPRLGRWEFLLVIAPLRVPGRHGVAGEPDRHLLIPDA